MLTTGRTAATGPGGRLGVALVFLMVLVGVADGQAPGGPQVGDLAPGFSLPGSDGRTYTLEEFRGVRPVVLAWFPKAFAKV